MVTDKIVLYLPLRKVSQLWAIDTRLTQNNAASGIAIDENSRNEFDTTMKKINLESKLDCLNNFPNQ